MVRVKHGHGREREVRHLQQSRAKHALDSIMSIKEDKKVSHSDFAGACTAAPSMIHVNGLGQTLAYCRSKGGVHYQVYRILSDWLTAQGQPLHGKGGDALKAITEGNMGSYLAAQAEAQEYLSWLKKFAKAYLGA